MKKKKRVICLIIIFIIIVILVGVKLYDKTQTISSPKIKFRANYDKKWSTWNNNGKIIEKIKSKKYLRNLEIKDNFSGEIAIDFYGENNLWVDELDFKEQYINGIRIDIFKASNYSICYRTYNDSDKWLGWSCNGEINGNKKRRITAVQIELIPKKAIKNEYLSDYDRTKESSKNF